VSIVSAVWRLLDRSQRRQLVWLQLLSIVMGLTTVAALAAVLPFFTALADPAASARYPLVRTLLHALHLRSDGSVVLGLGLAFAGIVVLANAVNLLGFLAITRFATRVGERLYVRLFNDYLHREYAFHTRSNSSVLAARVLQETSRVTSAMLLHGLVLVSNLVTIACILVSIVLVNAKVAVGVIAGLGASYAAIYLGVRGRLRRNGLSESHYYAERARTVSESFGAIKEITLVQAREFFVQRFAQQCRSFSRVVGNTLAISQSPKYVLECITITSLVAVALYLRGRADAGPWLAQLSFVGFAAYRLLPILQQAFSAIVKVRADRAAFESIAADLRQSGPEPSSPYDAVLERTWHGRPQHEIRLCNVSFQHAPDRPAAVDRLSLVIPSGAMVGFMGPNGSGKTTLLDLVSGLLLPQGGHVEIDGIVLDSSNRSAWQSTLAYVPQHAFLLDATFAENIALGVQPGEIDRARLENAVRLSGLEHCVASLPKGYHEALGEHACRLSGGQRQRLALARALYRQASVLILDEATSALDGAAENELIEVLRVLRRSRTILMVAHQTSALRACDVIVELAYGQIVASGPCERRDPPTRARLA